MQFRHLTKLRLEQCLEGTGGPKKWAGGPTLARRLMYWDSVWILIKIINKFIRYVSQKSKSNADDNFDVSADL